MFRTNLLSGSFAFAASALLVGCGGGAGGLFGSSDTTTSQPATLDGYVTSGGSVIVNSSNAIAVGDNAANEGRRGFVRFTLAGIPSGATIVHADLQMAQASVEGLPYALGTIRVDHMDLGVGLDAGDYGAVALASDVGTLSTNAVLTNKVLDVTSSVAADVAASRTTSDFRLRFPVTTDADGVIDSAHFEDMENNQGTGQLPVLIVTWK